MLIDVAENCIENTGGLAKEVMDRDMEMGCCQQKCCRSLIHSFATPLNPTIEEECGICRGKRSLAERSFSTAKWPVLAEGAWSMYFRNINDGGMSAEKRNC